MVIGLIAACEIGFWVLISLGLCARYVFKWPRVGAALLMAAPLVDLVLLIAVGVDLHGGRTATFAHALAATYLGFTIAYGHRMIRWADIHFAYRFAGGRAPVKLYGDSYTRACWMDALRTALAVGIAAAILWVLTLIAADGTELDALTGMYRILGIILSVELIWALSYTFWPRKAPGLEVAER